MPETADLLSKNLSGGDSASDDARRAADTVEMQVRQMSSKTSLRDGARCVYGGGHFTL